METRRSRQAAGWPPDREGDQPMQPQERRAFEPPPLQAPDPPAYAFDFYAYFAGRTTAAGLVWSMSCIAAASVSAPRTR